MTQGKGAPRLAAKSEEHEYFPTLDMEEVTRTVCSFLNGQGGRVIVGADSTGKSTGLADVAAHQSQLETHLREYVLPTAPWSTSIEKSNDGNSIIVVDVPTGTSKPYLIGGQIWCRHENENRPATPDDVSRLIRDRIRADERWERRPALGVYEDDLDLDEVMSAAEEIEKAGRLRFQAGRDAIQVLSELSLHDAGQFTNAAVVLFGKRPTATFPQAAVRVTVYETDKMGELLAFDELIESHLFGALRRALEIVRSKAGVTSEFHDDDVQRRDRPSYPFWSLREGLLNAFIHRDLSSSSGGMSVSIYPDRVAIWNYGALPDGWKLSDLTKDHPSMPRNPDIAHVCFLRGFIEKLGRGTQLISEEFSAAGRRKPTWESSAAGTTLTFFNKESSRRTAREGLSQRQLGVLGSMKPGARVTVGEYLNLVGTDTITERTARSDLNGLVDAGFFIRRGRGKNTFYERTDRTMGG